MTEKKFKGRLKIQIYVSVAIFLIGVAFLVKSVGVLNPESFASGYQTGLSGGLIGAGLVTFIVRLRILKNSDLFKKEFIKQTDERTVAISKTAMSYTFWISITSIGLVGYHGAFYNEVITKTCSFIVLGMLFVYCIAFWIANKKS